MDKYDGRIKKGEHRSPKTEFKNGSHWRNPKPFWNKEWLLEEYIAKQRTSTEIASEFGVSKNTILFWLKKHGIQARSTAETREIKYWGLRGRENPMYGRLGSSSSNWRGGCTPERQAFYSSIEWANAVRVVWKRDRARCRRCGVDGGRNSVPLHVHHIASFQIKEKRAEPENLVLVCRRCHIFIHSRKNTNAEFIEKEV